MADIVGNELKFIRLNEHDLIGRAMQVGFFEGYVITKAVELLKNKEPGIIVDIGANMGSFTVPLAFYNPEFNFVAFEPQRMVHYQLCGNLALNNIQNVMTVNCALGDKNQLIEIAMPDYTKETNIGAFSLDEEVRSHDDYLCKTQGNVERVEMHTMDTFGMSNIRLIKIDVEGMELDVLKGGLETLKRSNFPPILFEAWQSKDWYQPRRQELVKFLEDLGYEITCTGEDNFAIYKGEVNE